MIIAGLTLTRGGAVALIRDGRLEFGVGLPQLDYRAPGTAPAELELDLISPLLASQQFDVDDVDDWVVDGHGTSPADAPVRSGGAPLQLPLAPYQEGAPHPDPSQSGETGKLELGGKTKTYLSYPHLAGHVAAAYCTSPFAAAGEPAAVLVWDEDGYPSLYYVDDRGRIEPGGALFPLVGRVAASMISGLDLPGLATGEETPPAVPFLGELLIERLAAALRARLGDSPFNVCFAGDLALEPALNSALRSQDVVRAMWVPPFPDDAGSAIGAAAVHWSRVDGLRQLDWRIRLGREVERHLHEPAGWSVQPCRPEELARLLYRTGKPVVVLDGRAKLGSRGLGARNVLAPATDPRVPEWVGSAGQLRDHRPLEVFCLAESAPDVFDPGTHDPYQLFQHRVRAEWVDRLPAIRHPDGTARLQTVDGGDDQALATVLREYRSWSGIPLLCGVTAELPGHGPFPDVVSAMRWAGVDQVWSDGILHRRVRNSAG